MHLAASSGRKTTIGLLISNGADLNLKDSNGKTTLDYFTRFKEAIEQNTTNGDVHHSIDETISLLRKHGGKTGEELKAEGK